MATPVGYLVSNPVYFYIYMCVCVCPRVFVSLISKQIVCLYLFSVGLELISFHPVK